MPRLLVFLMIFLLALPLPAQTAPKRPGAVVGPFLDLSDPLFQETIVLIGELEREGKIQSYQTPDGRLALRIARPFRHNYAGRFTQTLSPEDMDAGINMLTSEFFEIVHGVTSGRNSPDRDMVLINALVATQRIHGKPIPKELEGFVNAQEKMRTKIVALNAALRSLQKMPAQPRSETRNTSAQKAADYGWIAVNRPDTARTSSNRSSPFAEKNQAFLALIDEKASEAEQYQAFLALMDKRAREAESVYRSNKLPEVRHSRPFYKGMMIHSLDGNEKATYSFHEAKQDVLNRLKNTVIPQARTRAEAAFWETARKNLLASGAVIPALGQDGTRKHVPPASDEDLLGFKQDYMDAERIHIGPGGVNPFALPQLQQAAFIFLGEEHTRDVPARSMIEALIAYNKTAPENQKITHVFVEFAYQLNEAMDFIRAHKGSMPKEALFEQARAYAEKQMGKLYIPAGKHQMERWMELGYRLLEEAPEVTFFAYDVPGLFTQRNRTAFDYAMAIAEQPHARAVFITGAGHSLRSNVNADIGFAGFDAAYSIPNMLSSRVPAERIVSIFMTGGPETDRELYGDPETYEAARKKSFSSVFLDNAGADAKKSFVIKTDPEKYGFDYYFHFPDN